VPDWALPRNPKFEARNPKQVPIANKKIRNKGFAVLTLGISGFEFASDFDIRVSNFWASRRTEKLYQRYLETVRKIRLAEGIGQLNRIPQMRESQATTFP
jgi:hypothetical protein